MIRNPKFKGMLTATLHAAMGATIAALLLACGSDTAFQGSHAPSADANPQPSPSPLPQPPQPSPAAALVELEWNWECHAEDNNLNLVDSDLSPVQVPMSGGGLHTLNVLSDDELLIKLNRTHCRTTDAPRDVVFIIDVSGSMRDNDPTDRATGNCGRYDAVNSIIEAARERNADIKAAIVTFDDRMINTSGRLMALDLLEASPSFNKSTLCAMGGGTNYQAGLAEAINLFADARPGAVREVYFVSDGVPDSGREGEAEAKILKDPVRVNATIATLMIQGRDEKLINIASRDRSGQPLHRRTSDAKQLASLIDELSRKDVTRGTISYRAVGSDDWYVQDFSESLALDQATIELPSLSRKRFPRGIQFKIEYLDNLGIIFSTEVATIRWQSSGAASEETAEDESKQKGKDKENSDRGRKLGREK
jgi:hypothetical protein